ncbi:hypothetical protein DU504_14085 [Haloplanus salinus]|uniref:Uncharacterized protein n=1 Tax=Haloplanus salinus TaxID=1126245 RepID=A0A368NEI3_9EURY|nr:hypothetical protein [Haloplanus salinus]RCU48333.1 hypothetical protein DU504_14085 [Haloplanus salinus]
MPQLRSCYFCGSVGDSLREYELVPERLVAAGESRSAVLCSDCREKLRRVLEPLIESTEATGTDRSEPHATDIGEVTFEAADATAGDAERTADGRDGGGDDDDAERTADGQDGGADDDDDAERTAGHDDDVPDGYYKVLRLLQNREFPMERADLTALVTGAYDVSEPQCDRIVETAVERGVLVADGSTLDTGRG